MISKSSDGTEATILQGQEHGADVRQSLADHFSSCSESSVLTKEYRFLYKGRRTTGWAIHIAALDPRGFEYLPDLLRMGADIRQECKGERSVHSVAKDHKVVSYMQPIHLAAGTGNLQVLMALIDKDRELVNVKARQQTLELKDSHPLEDVKDHYGALHEAVYADQCAAARLLLQLGADVNMTQIKGQTPLHIALTVPGSRTCVELLKERKADLSIRDNRKETPLITAIAYNQDKNILKLLVTPTLTELRDAAEEDAYRAVVLLNATDDKTWQNYLTSWHLTNDQTSSTLASDLAKLIPRYPRVAGKLLQVLTSEPMPLEPWEHPLPRYARRDQVTGRRRSLYMKDQFWPPPPDRFGDDFLSAFPSSSSAADAKARELRRGDGSPGSAEPDMWDECRARIKVLHFPNVICVEVLEALSNCTHEHQLPIFKVPAAQLIVEFAWTQCVRHPFTADLFLRVVELFMLFLVAVKAEVTRCENGYNALWSFISAMAIRDFLSEVLQVVGHSRHWGGFKAGMARYASLMNVVDWCSIFLVLYFAWNLPPHADGFNHPNCRRLLAGVSALKWAQVLKRLTPYRLDFFGKYNLGLEIISVFHSLFKMGGIMVVTMVLFMAFLQAYLALGVGDGTFEEVMLDAFRLLIMNDPNQEFVEDFSEASGREQVPLWFSHIVFFGSASVFCIVIMNLFVAALSEAFSDIMGTSQERFYANLASMCVDSMVQTQVMVAPGFDFGCKSLCHRRYAVAGYTALLAVGLVVWGCLVALTAVPVSVMVLWSLCVLLLGDYMLRNRLWYHQGGEADWSPGKEDSGIIGQAYDVAADRDEGGCGARSNDPLMSPRGAGRFRRSTTFDRRKQTPRYLMWCMSGDETEFMDLDSEDKIERVQDHLDKVAERVEHMYHMVEQSCGTIKHIESIVEHQVGRKASSEGAR